MNRSDRIRVEWARTPTASLRAMFYGLSEFEITDPDGHVLCLAEKLRNDRDLPKPEE